MSYRRGAIASQFAVPIFAAPVVAVPTVTGLTVTTGSTAGGTSTILTGTNFVGVTSVQFGLVAASSYVVNSPNSITAISPAEAAGTVNVTVTTANGTSATGVANQFVYSSSGTFLPNITGNPSTIHFPGINTNVPVPTNLLFHDEFSVGYGTGGNMPNPAYWTPTFPGNALNNVTTDPANVNLVPATGLEISLVSSSHGGCVNGGNIGSATSPQMFLASSAKPVYIEYKFSVPGSAGHGGYGWPAIWATAYNANWPGTELDLMECSIGNNGGFQYHSIYRNNGGSYPWPNGAAGPGSGSGSFAGAWSPSGGGSGPPPVVSWTSGFHTVGCLWYPTGSCWVFDGTPTIIISGTDPTGLASSVNLNTAVGLVMNYGYSGDITIPSYPQTMVVRYVRVWQ